MNSVLMVCTKDWGIQKGAKYSDRVAFNGCFSYKAFLVITLSGWQVMRFRLFCHTLYRRYATHAMPMRKAKL
jgi:hypothetical protein